MSEYDLQFQADLEKAQALSIESLALEEFRRQRQLASSGVPGDSNGSNGTQLASRRREDSEGAPPPALPPPPRRLSRGRSLLTEAPRSNGTSPTREAASDLISFTSPTSKTAPKDSHASLKEYIDQITKLGQQTEEITLSTPTEQPPSTMNNHNPYYGQRPPGYQYAQYNYHQPAYHHPSPYHHPPPHQQPYPIPPYPTTPYGMPSPMPNYNYYPATGQEIPQQNPGSPVVASPGLYPNIPYSQTRMASPYVGYPPPTQVSIPQYNYNTTNMISRPSRPANLYPQLSQMHMYPPMPGNSSPSGNNNLSALAVKTEKNRDSVESNVSRKSSEVSIGSMESQDVLGSLPKSLNLIDFRKVHSGPGSVRVSVLEAFDPLLTDTPLSEYAVGSECSSSVYEEYDPLDFLYGETEMRDTPVYATISKRDAVILPSPPPKTIPTVPAITKRSTTNKLYDCIVQVRTKTYDNEHKAFLKMVLDVRNKFVHSDSDSNPGCVIASRGGGRYPPNTSIKLVVHADTDEPITFTSDVESTVDHVILTVVCSLDEDIREDMSGYMLRVWGAQEYLKPGSALSEYDYVRSCVRLEKDVTLVLQVARDAALARSERDDAMGARVSLEDLVPSQGAAALSFDNLSILLETLEGELSRAVGVTGAEGTCSPTGVFQAVKAICALAGGVETLHVTHTLNAFAQSCSAQGNNVVTPEILSDNGEYCAVSIRGATAREAVSAQCTRVRDAVRSLLALYTRNTILDFRLAEQHLTSPGNIENAIESHKLSESTLFCIEAIHSLPPCWNHDEYVLHAQIHYGTRALNRLHTTQPSKVESAGFYPRIIFDTWLNLEDMPVQSLARESRLVLTLYGRTQRAVDSQQAADAPANPQHAPDAAEQFDTRELAWTALQLFDIDGMLASGNYILPLWPVCVDKRTGPAPHPGHAPPQPYPVVNIEVPLYAHGGVKWSADSRKCKQLSRAALPAFDSLDGSTQSQLLHLVEQGAYQRMPTECREVLWEKRQYLVELPGALPLVLLAATNWSPEHRSNLVSLVKLWARPSPINAMHLLLPCFPDAAVREVATEIMSSMSDDDFRRVLPQLAQALRHETHDASALAALLLTRALSSPPVALALFWHLTHSLPNVPQAPNQEFLGITLEDNGGASQEGDPCMAATGRYRLLLRALLATCGENLSRALISQQLLVKTLSDVAFSVKAAKEGMRQRALTSGMEQLASLVRGEPSALPLGLACTVHDVDVKSCSYFSSNTLPLKVNFVGTDNAVIPAMFKVGDDLRQDALVLQVMRVMDNLWLKAGLDLRMVTFQAVPTNNRRGMIEIVSEAETLRAIQTEWGLTGSFKDKPIAEWLAKHNPSELEYQRARDNFTASCAGYSVATYLLGICDRHNDNIMLKTSGHLFHIDFGKFLGDAQMFGNFKRDRAPFVLTSDMVYVINGGERPTQRFQHFVELCCMAFNIVRAHHDHVLDLFALMASSGVPGVTSAAVNYVRAALMPGVSNAEAAAAFAKLIHSSLKSKFTPINFFLHNLAQLRASGDQGSNSSDLLSFIPRTYTMAQEGRLVNVECLGYEKRYDPEKHYVYALRVHRQGQSTPAVLYRSYKHFTELYQKICLHFPLAKVHCLPSGLHVGRSNTRIVAERRFGDVQAFLQSLFNLADEIAHSDLVYTFFHPLLRDQQDVEPQRMKHKAEPVEAEGSGSGSLKLSVQYSGGVLSVLILHAQSLALTPQGLPPNPYVKVYLVPDPNKETKRKTRVLKRNSHPSFMDMLEYRLPLEVIKTRSLQATVWNYDSLQENQFLGGVVVPLATLPLREETVAWYPLEYIPR